MASKRISSITGELVLNVNKWSSGIKSAQKDAKALQDSLKPTTEIASSVGKGLTAAGVAMGAALVGVTKRAADYGDQIQKASIRTGIGTKELSAYKLLAERSDTSFETLSGSIGKLSSNIFDAATNAKGEGARAFKALGIEVKDAGGNVRNVSEILPQVVDRLSKMEDGTAKVAVAQKFFGKSAADLIPLINDGSEGFRKAAEDVRKFGLEVNDADAAIAAGLGDAMTDLETAANGLGNSIGKVLIPSFTKGIEKATEWTMVLGEAAREHPELTKAAAGTAAALTGAGGLLLGFSGVVSLGSKVVVAFDKIGGSAGLLKGGLVALAVGGILVVEKALRDLQKTGTDTTSFFDTLKAGVVAGTGPIYAARLAINEFKNSWEALSGKSQTVDSALVGLNKRLTENDTVSRAAAAAIAGQTTKTDGLDASTKQLVDSLTKANKEVDSHANKVKQLNEAFIQSVKPADDLQKTLGLLKGELATQSNILKVYGPQIIETVEAQKAMGRQVSALMANYYALAKAQEVAIEGDKELQDLLNQRAARMEKWNETLENSKVGMTEWTVEIDRSKQANLEGMIVLGQMRGSIGEVTSKIDGMRKAGASDAQIIAVLDGEMRSAEATARKLGVALDPTIIKLLNQADAADRAAARAKNLQDAWGRAMSNMVRETAYNLADMVVDWDFSMKGMVNTAKNTAKDLLGSFLEGFFQPFADKLDSLGRKAGSFLADAVFGGSSNRDESGSAGGGILGGLLGGVFGGGSGENGSQGGILGRIGDIFGGGAPNQGGWPGTPPFVPGGAPRGGMFGGGGGFMGFLSSPLGGGLINAGVQAGLEAAKEVGAGRDAANEIVKSQEPFTATIAEILNNSNLTGTQKSNLIEQRWAEFQANARAFAGNDPHNQIVMNQAFGTLQPFVNRQLMDLAPWVEREGLSKMQSNGVMSGNVTVNAPLTLNVSIDGSNITTLEVRDVIAPELTTLLETGVRGIREKWAQLLNLSSPSTPAPVGI